ncbi:Cytochrome P450 76C4 [Acorus calamus]|uniref:Cytochrome P450 76C4 n=1 Tax=Acorus calamus TaxID=4465 RepID=A0AAV9DHM9_ACOCL|nr:Cytochrome P450 76C4 [Acorus calamus]
MAELLHNPKAMARAQAELSEIIGFGNPIEESDIVRRSSHFTRPPVPFLIPRKAEADVDVSGFAIPKHVQVLWAEDVLGRAGRGGRQRGAQVGPGRRRSPKVGFYLFVGEKGDDRSLWLFE